MSRVGDVVPEVAQHSRWHASMLLLGMVDGGISILRLNQPLPLLLQRRPPSCGQLAFLPQRPRFGGRVQAGLLPACTVRLEVGFVVPLLATTTVSPAQRYDTLTAHASPRHFRRSRVTDAACERARYGHADGACLVCGACLLACLETGPVPAYSHALERRSGPRNLHKYRVLAHAPFVVGGVLPLT